MARGRLERRLDRPQADELAAGPDVRVARLAGEAWGVLSIGELRSCGLSGDAVAGRVRNGRLHPIHRGVYAVGHANPPLQGRFLAAVKACGRRAVLSHFSAAALLGLVDWDGRRLEVTVCSPGRRVHKNVRVHRTNVLEERDIALRDGIPITAPARTLVDLASVLDQRGLRRAARQAQSLGHVDHRGLAEAMDRLRPRRGIVKLARVLATGPAPTRSELEDVVLDLMLRGGLERPDVNVPLVLGRRRVIPDFRWPAQRLVVEADGAAWHDDKLAREDDAERQALLEAHGERVLRVTWRQAVAERAVTLARFRAAGAPAAGRAAT
jgi:very-short-patch-repair endonuclease